MKILGIDPSAQWEAFMQAWLADLEAMLARHLQDEDRYRALFQAWMRETWADLQLRVKEIATRLSALRQR